MCWPSVRPFHICPPRTRNTRSYTAHRSGPEQYERFTREKARQIKEKARQLREAKEALQKLPTSRAQQSSGPALKEPQAPSGPQQPAQPARGSAHVPAPRRISAPADRAPSPSAFLSTELAKVRLEAGPSPREGDSEQQRDKRRSEGMGQAVGTGPSPAKVAKVTDETVMGPPSTPAGSDDHPGDSGEIALS